MRVDSIETRNRNPEAAREGQNAEIQRLMHRVRNPAQHKPFDAWSFCADRCSHWVKGFLLGAAYGGLLVGPLLYLISRQNRHFHSPYSAELNYNFQLLKPEIGEEKVQELMTSPCPISTIAEIQNTEMMSEIGKAMRKKGEILTPDKKAALYELFYPRFGTSVLGLKWDSFLDLVIKTPLVEELLFKGVGQEMVLRQPMKCLFPRAYDQAIKKIVRVVATALMFSVCHNGAAGKLNPVERSVEKVYAFGLGLLTGVLKESNFGLAGSLGAHMGNNFATLIPTLLSC